MGTREATGPRLWRVNIAPHPLREVHVATSIPQPPTHIIQDDDPVLSRPTPADPPQPVTLATSSRPTTHSHAYNLPSVPALITYLHAAAGYPVKLT
jgi:hypothetical protein